MKPEIQFIEHTADIRLKIRAETLKELFHSALSGMNDVLKTRFCRKRLPFTSTRNIHIKSPDTTTLLIDFLSEVLTLSHMNKVVYCRLNIITLQPLEISGVLEGCDVDCFDEDIKAVTYHEAEVGLNSEKNWETMILFDI